MLMIVAVAGNPARMRSRFYTPESIADMLTADKLAPEMRRGHHCHARAVANRS